MALLYVTDVPVGLNLACNMHGLFRSEYILNPVMYLLTPSIE